MLAPNTRNLSMVASMQSYKMVLNWVILNWMKVHSYFSIRFDGRAHDLWTLFCEEYFAMTQHYETFCASCCTLWTSNSPWQVRRPFQVLICSIMLLLHVRCYHQGFVCGVLFGHVSKACWGGTYWGWGLQNFRMHSPQKYIFGKLPRSDHQIYWNCRDTLPMYVWMVLL